VHLRCSGVDTLERLLGEIVQSVESQQCLSHECLTGEVASQAAASTRFQIVEVFVEKKPQTA
jgi:hypothetical protein